LINNIVDTSVLSLYFLKLSLYFTRLMYVLTLKRINLLIVVEKGFNNCRD